MPIRPPALDDRGFDDLVAEALSRIPAHTPEWRNPRLGDPGRTLVELFAWLTDTLLYRANLIPERQRLAFLRLLNLPLRPAAAATGLVTVSTDAASAVNLRAAATLAGPVAFETLSELTVQPVSARAYRKRPLDAAEHDSLADVVDGLRRLHGTDSPVPYVTTPVFADGLPEPDGVDIASPGLTVDGTLWLALFAGKKESIKAAREALGKGPTGAPPLLNVGVVPTVRVPALFEEIGPRGRVPVAWEVSSGRDPGGVAEYFPLDVVADTTEGLRRRGVLRLAMPAPERIGALPNDVRAALDAGVGDRPPRLDDRDLDDRLVAWVRLRPLAGATSLAVSWVGVNAVEIDQRQTTRGRVIGVSDGSPRQEFPLPAAGVDGSTLQLQVEETDRGYQPWSRTDDLALTGRDDAVYTLDAEAGIVGFGDNLNGRIPGAQQRIRVASMRAGGGAAGNLLPGVLTSISAVDLDGAAVSGLKVFQPIATEGGGEAETLDQAELRLPARLRHADRAVTADDFRVLAGETSGVRLGRVEVLPKFLPHQRRSGVPGVVSVVVIPAADAPRPPNPRPDRPLLEAVHAQLDACRLLSTELYTIGCEYVPLGVSAGVTVLDGFGRDGVLNGVREALRRFLWPLDPGGPRGGGWPLGRNVSDRELEVVVARVPGVDGVAPVRLFGRDGDRWRAVPRQGGGAGPAELPLQPWQLPELLAVVVVADADAPDDLDASPAAAPGGVPVPVVPDLC